MGIGSATGRGSAEAAAWDGGHGWAVAQDLMFVAVSGVGRRSGLLVSYLARGGCAYGGVH